MHAFEVEEGTFFRWQNDVYRMEQWGREKPGTVPDTLPVIRVAGLWPAATNPHLREDTWIPTNTKQVERFNSHAEVVPVVYIVSATVYPRRNPVAVKTTWTGEERETGVNQYDEGIMLYQSGDMFGDHPNQFTGFDDFRAKFKEQHERDTTLTDDQILILIMSANDEEEHDWFLNRVESAEEFFKEDPRVFNKLAEAAAAEAEHNDAEEDSRPVQQF